MVTPQSALSPVLKTEMTQASFSCAGISFLFPYFEEQGVDVFKEDRSTFFQDPLSWDAVRPSSLVVFHCPDSVLHLFQTGWFSHSLNDGQLRELDQGLHLCVISSLSFIRESPSLERRDGEGREMPFFRAGVF